MTASCVARRATVDQTMLQALNQARRAGYLVTRCPHCGGPLVHSKQRQGGARCFRCRARVDENIRGGFRRCGFCGGSLAGLPLQASLCRRCAAVPAKQRKRRLLRRAEASEGHSGGAGIFASETP
jgi:hypothetical protein